MQNENPQWGDSIVVAANDRINSWRDLALHLDSDNKKAVSIIQKLIFGEDGAKEEAELFLRTPVNPATDILAERVAEYAMNKLEFDWKEWNDIYPYRKYNEDLVIEMHHVLTEPTCPVVRIKGETSGNKIASGSGNTMFEALENAINKAMKYEPSVSG
jgi:hypothetical protein